MMAADLTKFTLVIVLLGGVLAMAVFRPPIFASPPVKADTEQDQGEMTSTGFQPESEGDEEEALSYKDLLAWQQELDKRQSDLDDQQAILKDWEERLAEQASLLGAKENEVIEEWVAIQAEQTRLAQERESLQAEQTRLVQERENLEAERARLDQDGEDLQARRARLDEELASLRETEDRLQAKEASLAEWQQKLEGRDRLSAVALIVSGLMAVPSVVVLIALVQQGWRMPGDRAQQAQAPQVHKRKRGIQSGTLGKVTAVPTYGDNGRGRESVGHPA
jgi:predicted nuclease with TOPRIM domain